MISIIDIFFWGIGLGVSCAVTGWMLYNFAKPYFAKNDPRLDEWMRKEGLK